MIRIDVVEHTQKQVVLQVQGDLHTREMDLLEGEMRRWQAQVAQVVLDLTKVPVVNWVGLGRLAQWVQAPPLAEPGTGARLTLRCSSRGVRNQLRAHGVPVEG